MGMGPERPEDATRGGGKGAPSRLLKAQHVLRTRLLGFNYKRTLRALVNNASNFEIDKTASR